MQIRIDTHGIDLPDTATVEHLTRRTLNRLSDSVTRVLVSLRDDSGSGGSREKVCTVCIELGGGGQVLVVDRSTSLKRSIGRGLRRTRSLVAKQIKKRRRTQRRLFTSDWQSMLPTS